MYGSLKETMQGGDRAAVAALAEMSKGRLEKVSGLLQTMRRLDDVASGRIGSGVRPAGQPSEEVFLLMQ